MLGFDVGGSHKSQAIGYESFGVRGQNRVITEGIDTTEGTERRGHLSGLLRARGNVGQRGGRATSRSTRRARRSVSTHQERRQQFRSR